MIARASLATMGALLAGAAQACEVPTLDKARKLDDGAGSSLVWRFVPAQPKIGEFFAIEFGGCALGGPLTAEAVRVDATMPAHRHGMNFKPRVTTVGPNLLRAEGMMFHMPGTWQLSFEQRSSAGIARLTTDVEIE